MRVRIQGDDLLPGMIASTELPLRALNEALVVPVTAILQEDGSAYLFKVVNDNLQRVSVTAGLRDADDQVVTGDIVAGDLIVSRDVAALSDGQTIVVFP